MERLELVDVGSLARPGPVGRLVRLALGVICLPALWSIAQNAGTTIARPYSSLDETALLLLPLCCFNYVVNIGFSKSWGHRPMIVALVSLAGSAALAFLSRGHLDSPIAGVPLVMVLAYFYGHLGISFVIAAVIATPGCEMRAIPQVIGRMRGNPSDEHRCPVAFISKIDEWEQQRRKAYR